VSILPQPSSSLSDSVAPETRPPDSSRAAIELGEAQPPKTALGATRNGGNDAVCFTAGLTGTIFGAGAIHAYLAADRDHPAVVAGISTGAINAVALQRCYHELQACRRAGERGDAPRWKWFRQYLSVLKDEPLGVIWRGLPRLTDFSADLPPVQDPAIDSFGAKDSDRNAYWRDQEKLARRELFLFMKMASWLVRLPLKISLIATFLVSYVRLTEQMPEGRFLRRIQYALTKLYIGLVIVTHTALHPFWFKEWRFKTTPKTEIKFFKPSYWLRPLLGWRLYFLSWMVLLILGEVILVSAQSFARPNGALGSALTLLIGVLGGAGLVILYFERRPIQGFVWSKLLPPVASHIRRVVWIILLFGAEWALVKLNNIVLGFDVLHGSWLEVWRYTLTAGFVLYGLCLSVVWVLEAIAIAAFAWRKGRTWIEQRSHPVAWIVGLALATTFSILSNLYLTQTPILKVITSISVGACGLSLLSFLALKVFQIALRFSTSRPHPIVSFVLKKPWTAGLALLESLCFVLMAFGKYRETAELFFIVLLCAESLEIATRAILKARKSDAAHGRLQIKGTLKKRIGTWICTQVFRNLEMEREMVHKFQLILRLTQLFGSDGDSFRLTEEPMPVVIVAAPLQTLNIGGSMRGVSQVWAKKGIRIVDALSAAVAWPGLYEPTHFDQNKFSNDKKDITFWDVEKPPAILDLVDGAKIRENPLPALFQFLKRDGRESVAEALESSPQDPRVHIVFAVPVRPLQGSLEPDPLGVNVVDVALASRRLNRRRDSELEIQQTNFMGELEFSRRQLGQAKSIAENRKQRLYPIFADAIAPEGDLTFSNPLRPDAGEVLKMVAHGCRRTLQTIYKAQLKTFQPDLQEVNCHEFLSSVAQSRNSTAQLRGLPEVCGLCTCKLQKHRPPDASDSDEHSLEHFGHLNGTSPRIVFLASGGVFRGAFHAGMLACLLSTDIRPDVIVGASVGSLMGGTLGAMLTARNGEGEMDYSLSLELLMGLVDVLLNVDKKVAFTKILKTAARDFGIRARNIRLSPNQIRRMVKRGSRKDPGYAATGAPPALIDGISSLLFIPHTTTAWIAARFVAGHVTEATKRLLNQIKKETLRRLDVEYSLMGVSLLEPTARQLLGSKYRIPLDVPQPFLEDGIAFFATTTNLLEEKTFLLGCHPMSHGEHFDFVQGTLASSAFPAIFAPRRESDIFPGTGRIDVLFSDGGMFDNLPFIPAIELMASVQREYWEKNKKDLDPIDFLERRHRAPDLFIAGSLNVPPEEDEYGDDDFDDLITIRRRASSLQDNIKIRSFQGTADAVHEEIELILKTVPKKASLDERTIALFNGVVEAEVLPVFPIDRDHLNPTYAFCASVGLKKDRVRRSIVNGCFQTFAALANSQLREPPHELRQAKRSIDVLTTPGTSPGGGPSPRRIPIIWWRPKSKAKGEKVGLCPYFAHSRSPRVPRKPGATWNEAEEANAEPRPFVCPFHEAHAAGAKAKIEGAIETGKLYEICRADVKQNKVHRDVDLRVAGEGARITREHQLTAVLRVLWSGRRRRQIRSKGGENAC
jgi:predicted acylesterase/phospholipase RssA